MTLMIMSKMIYLTWHDMGNTCKRFTSQRKQNTGRTRVRWMMLDKIAWKKRIVDVEKYPMIIKLNAGKIKIETHWLKLVRKKGKWIKLCYRFLGFNDSLIYTDSIIDPIYMDSKWKHPSISSCLWLAFILKFPRHVCVSISVPEHL